MMMDDGEVDEDGPASTPLCLTPCCVFAATALHHTGSFLLLDAKPSAKEIHPF